MINKLKLYIIIYIIVLSYLYLNFDQLLFMF